MYPFIRVQYVIGCYATCTNVTLKNGKCSGAGCCEAEIPKGTIDYHGYFNENYNTTKISQETCSYTVLMEKAAFSFNTSYVDSTVFNDTYKGAVPMVLNWRIGSQTCEVAKTNLASYACVSRYSECVDTAKGNDPGYRCNCSHGYKGNPYIKDGCIGSSPFPAIYILHASNFHELLVCGLQQL
jgi:hypothetical protein